MKANMPTPPASDSPGRNRFSPIFSRLFWKSFGSIAASVLFCSSCGRLSAETLREDPKLSVKSAASVWKDARKKNYRREGYAVWYPVPAHSLAKRRAGKDELTAAHNHLRIGTMVRVTHLANGKSVIVRITDRGITKRRASIDLCKEAAVKLDMIGEGMARVRMEELPDDKDTAAAPASTPTAAHP
jgi:rare lipoprotein A